jgi:hypothetical protein
MVYMNLRNMARELLLIEEDFRSHLTDSKNDDDYGFELHTFEQHWGNTTGGFEGFGGAAITTQNTYVIIPRYRDDDCLVYFGEKYAYSVPVSHKFLEDVMDKNVAGINSYKNKY